MNLQIINGNNIEVLKQYPDNHFDAVVTDPPYGLGKEPNAEQMLRAWIDTGFLEVSGSGFMGKEWDAFVPQPLFWKEVFRVLKPGGHILSFFGTRTYDWGVMAMRLAGFEVRDCIQWLYGSGFPKSHNISKAIDKMYGAEREVVGQGKAGKGFNKVKGFGTNTTKSDEFTSEWDVTESSTDQAKQWDGWGSALKPANEPIVLARKPLEKGLSIAENVLKWGTGGINIDGCRVGFTDNVNLDAKQKTNNLSKVKFFDEIRNDLENPIETYKANGRFPANFIMTHHPDCVCVGTKKVKAIKGGSSGSDSMNEKGYGFKKTNNGANAGGLGDENGEETIENWNCHDDCPIKIMDEQSGVLKSGKMTPKHTRTTNGSPNGIYGKFDVNHPLSETYGDSGGASRFFYCAKASKSERNFGLDGFEEKRPNVRDDKGMGTFQEKGFQIQKNFHPTVKPVKLMQYLVRLITPPNGLVLDPFSGSGTTGIACKLEGFNFVGIEQDAEYCKISEARISAWNEIEEYEYYKSTTKANNIKDVDEKFEDTYSTEANQLCIFDMLPRTD